MITGSCLCAGVRYEIHGEIGPALNCHCSMCRKMTGAAFRSRVAIPTENFRWVKDDNQKTLGLAMGTLDDDPGIRPTFHVFVGSKAAWFEITDQLPRFDTFPRITLVRQDGSLPDL